MEKLKSKILKEAYIIDNRIIKVDHFINHMLDTKLVFEIGKEFANEFSGINKILTIEASGIAFSVATAFHLDNVPIVFARKSASLITTDNVYKSKVFSFTKQIESTIIVDKEFLNPGDNVLIIDDFLATGNALNGLIDIANQANAKVRGVGIVIEKGYQGGRKRIEDMGIKVHSLANIKRIEDGKVVFEENND